MAWWQVCYRNLQNLKNIREGNKACFWILTAPFDGSKAHMQEISDSMWSFYGSEEIHFQYWSFLQCKHTGQTFIGAFCDFFLHNIKKPLLSSPLSIKPLAWLKIILFNIMVFRTNTSINHLFIFVMVCVKSNLCRTGAGRPRNPLQPWRRKKRNVTPRGQWPPLLGYRGSCTRAGPGSQVSRLAHSALPWRLPAQPSICKAVEGDPRGPLLASLAKHRS